MMGIPLKEDLARGGENIMVHSGDQQSMQKSMVALWVKSIEYALITWRTRGFLLATPTEINGWYKRGTVTADMVKGIFENQFSSVRETSKAYQKTIYGQAGFKVGIASRVDTRHRRGAKVAKGEKAAHKAASGQGRKGQEQGTLTKVTGSIKAPTKVLSVKEAAAIKTKRMKEAKLSKRKKTEEIKAEKERRREQGKEERDLRGFYGQVRPSNPMEEGRFPQGDG